MRLREEQVGRGWNLKKIRKGGTRNSEGVRNVRSLRLPLSPEGGSLQAFGCGGVSFSRSALFQDPILGRPLTSTEGQGVNEVEGKRVERQ